MSRLQGVQLKIERAKHHVRDLESRIGAFRESNPNLLLCDQDPQTGERVFGLQTQLPVEFSLIVGDAVHSLRSALDHLVCRLVEAHSAESIDSASFPICDTPASFANKRTAKKIKGVHADAVKLIEDVQPYKIGYESLGILSKLDNADKHRVLLVVAYGVQEFGFSYFNAAHPALKDPTVRALVEKFRSQTIQPAGIQPAERSPIVFQGGAELARISWPDGPPPQVDEKLHLAFELAINEPEIGVRQPVVLLLTQLSQLVESVVNMFVPCIWVDHDRLLG